MGYAGSSFSLTLILAGSYNTPGWVFQVYISGNHAYIADSHAGLHVVDISNPSSPRLAGSYRTKTPRSETMDVYISGNYAYIADRNAGLQVVDISIPTSPTLVR